MKIEPLSSSPVTAAGSPQRGAALAGIAAAASVIIGLLVLACWYAGVSPMRSLSPGFVPMNPMTALAFCLAGVSLWLSSMGGRGKPYPISKPLAWLVVVIGVVRLVGYALHWEKGIDQWLFPDDLDLDGAHPSRMAPNAAFGLLLIGLALVFHDTTTAKGRRPSELLAAATGAISLIAIIGYVYAVKPMYGVSTFNPMALHTAIVFQLLSLGVLFARPDRGAMAVVTAGSSGGIIARRLFPAVLVAFVILGGLRLAGERRGYYGPEVAVTLYTAITILTFGVIIGWIAGKLHRADVERAKLGESLRQRSKELAVMNEDLEAFSYSVSHDLRTPLRHIAGFTGLLGRRIEAADENSQRLLTSITESTRKMNQLIEDLLAFAKIGRVALYPEPVDLKLLAGEVRASFEPDLRGREVTWVLGDMPAVVSDSALLRQVLANLLGNAIKYTRKNPEARIEIEATQTPSETIVVIRDNGAGFDMKHANQLFGMFQRLHSASDFEGSGVGLANVRKIIQRLGGRTWAEGTPGVGATFYFSLPRN